MFKVSGFSIGGRLLRPIFRYVLGLLAKEVSSYLPSSKKTNFQKFHLQTCKKYGRTLRSKDTKLFKMTANNNEIKFNNLSELKTSGYINFYGSV